MSSFPQRYSPYYRDLETNVALLKMELVLFLKHVPMRLTHELREPFH